MSDLAVLGLRFETIGADAANRQLDGVTTKSGRAEKASEALTASLKRQADAFSSMRSGGGDAYIAAANAMRTAGVEANDFSKAAQDAGFSVAGYEMHLARLAREHVNTAQKTVGAVKATGSLDAHVLAYRTNLERLPAATARATQATVGIGDALLVAGQRAAGAAAQAAGLGGMLTTIAQASVPILGAAGLLGAVAVAIGVVAVAAIQGEKDSNRFANAIAITGQYAGITTTQYENMVRTVQAGTESGFGAARKTLLALVSTGQFTRETIQYLSQDIIKLAQFTGQSAEQVTSSFAGMGTKVGDFAVKFNASYHMLTLAQIEHIRMLEEQGQVTEAQLSLSIAIHERLGQIGPENLGFLERAWRGVGNAISWAWEQLKGFGRDQGAEANIARINGLIAENERVGGVHPSFTAGLIAQRDALQVVLDRNRAQSESARLEQAGVDAAERLRSTWSGMGDNIARANREIARYRSDIEAVRRVSPNSPNLPTATQQTAAEADIMKRYTPDATAAASRAASAAQSAAAAAARRAEALAREMAALQATASANFDLAEAYGVSDAAALRAAAASDATGKAITRRGDIDSFVAAQLRVNASKEAASAAQRIADLRFQANALDRVNAAVSAGTLTAQQASEQLALEAQLRPIIAAATVVEGEQKQVLLRLIDDLTAATTRNNEVNREAQLIQANLTDKGRVDQLENEIRLVAAANRERAVMLALFAKERELSDQGINPNSDAYRDAMDYAARLAGLNVDLSREQAAHNYELAYQLDLLRQIDDQTRTLAGNLSDAFGAPGRALGDMISGLTGMRAQLQAITDAERDYRKEVGEGLVDQNRIGMFARERADIQIQAYGDMLGAAKGYFSEGSDGYKALAAAEQAYRAIQFALSVQAMIMGGQETAATVGQNVIKAASHGVVAVARALASLPFPFNLAAGAATIAALAAIGVRLFGGSGGGGGAAGTYNPAPINSRETSIATARGQASASQGAAANGAQRVDVRVTADDRRFNAYVDDRTIPRMNAVGAASVQTSRAAVPADRSRSEAFKMGGRGR